MSDARNVRKHDQAAPSAGRFRALWINFAVLLVSVAVSLLLIEVVFRMATGLPVLSLANWRTERVVFNRIGDRAQLDPYLGWTVKPNFRSEWHNTLEHGIRRNATETAVRTGAVLAVGDSFTEGWEVEDDDSWPAYLELMTGTPVVNGAVGGYGTDQIILRAEQLLPVVQPKILIVGFLEFDIFRTAHTHFGAPKPWFSFEGDELRYHPPAAVEPEAERDALTRAKFAARDALSYSAAVDYLMARLAANYWYGSGRQEYIRGNDIDAVRVTCALLGRLKQRVDQDGIRMLLFMQYYARVILENDQPPENARRVVTCADRLGIQVVDQFRSLKALTTYDREALREYYKTFGEIYNHMSGEGNEHAAELLAKALRENAPARH